MCKFGIVWTCYEVQSRRVPHEVTDRQSTVRYSLCSSTVVIHLDDTGIRVTHQVVRKIKEHRSEGTTSVITQLNVTLC